MEPTSTQLRLPLEEPLAEAAAMSRPGEDTATVMGLPLDALDEPSLVRAFQEGVRSGRGGWIVTPNLDILRQFTTDAESRELILAATHRIADGAPIVWASRLASVPVPERVAGSDLAFSLPEAAAEAGARVSPRRKPRRC